MWVPGLSHRVYDMVQPGTEEITVQLEQLTRHGFRGYLLSEVPHILLDPIDVLEFYHRFECENDEEKDVQSHSEYNSDEEKLAIVFQLEQLQLGDVVSEPL